jgi:N-acetylglucosamine-6-phosphate deacetylase
MVISGRLADRRGRDAPGWLSIGRGRIEAVGAGTPPRPPDVEHHGVIAPGLVDLQVNGAGGHDALDGGPALDRIDDLLARRGVSAWLAALPTAEDEHVAAVVEAARERVLDPAHGLSGLHLEGPFLAPEHAGAHRRQLLRPPSSGVPDHYLDPVVRLVTLAPELDGALALIARLRRAGIAVSLGHSGADADTAARALDAGATLVTHLFNAMAPLHHRAPGLVGVALTDPRARPCLIADGVHVDPLLLRLCRTAAGDRLILVSDAAAPAGAPAGRYELGGSPVMADAAGVIRTADGTIAGSGVLLDRIIGQWMVHTGAGAAEAVAAAAWRPGSVAGHRALTVGAPADVVLLGEQGDVVRVLRRGRWLAPAGAG